MLSVNRLNCFRAWRILAEAAMRMMMAIRATMPLPRTAL
jgi:hypothetical protein